MYEIVAAELVGYGVICVERQFCEIKYVIFLLENRK